MKKILILFALLSLGTISANGQLGKKINLKKAASAATKTVQAFTLSDEQMAEYVREYTEWLDANNPLCSVNDQDPGMRAVAERLESIIANAPDIAELKLDVRAFYVSDVNAFACPDGTIRVFAGLMQLMTDDEILGIIGHEVGHIVNKDSKEAFRKALLGSALKDAAGATSDKIQALTDSQFGELAEAFATAQYSQKAEYAADEYGYNFIERSGKDPKAMADALRVLVRLQEEAGAGSSSKINQLFSSHPESAKRAERLDKMYEEQNK